MKTGETLKELADIRLRVHRLRVDAKYVPWFNHLLKAIEALLDSTITTVECIVRASK